MLLRTHIAVGLAVAFYFLPHVVNKLYFLPVVLIASALPDIDTGYSSIGRKKIFRPIQLMTRHRGIFHTYTFCILVSLLFAFFYPVLALPFFLGYSLHIYLDSFTELGVAPFWPYRGRSMWKIKTGGKVEQSFFIFLGERKS